MRSRKKREFGSNGGWEELEEDNEDEEERREAEAVKYGEEEVGSMERDWKDTNWGK